MQEFILTVICTVLPDWRFIEAFVVACNWIWKMILY